jgi:hypothetical protein
LTAFNLILLVFLFPETKYHRDAPTRSAPQVQEQYSAEQKNVNAPDQEIGVGSLVGRGFPAKRQFKIIQRPDPRWKSFLFRDIFSPL